MKPIIFISGPMANRENANMASFHEAARDLESLGWTVLGPHLLPVIPREKAMLICIAMIEQADAVLFLPNWQNSCGVLAEYNFAHSINKPFFHQALGYPKPEDLYEI